MRRVIAPAALLLLVGSMWLGWAPPNGASSQESASLSTLEIDIWPEFDRPAVLVIVRGALAPDVSLPATLSLRIPSSAGDPAALAYASEVNSRLFDLNYERTDVQLDFTTITFTTPGRFIQMEFYDPVETGAADRSYTYIWPGDLSASQVSVQAQQPAGATDFSVLPELGAAITGADGLVYREADLGSLDTGKVLTVAIQYQKSDPRTSVEILGLNTEAPAATESDGAIASWMIILGIVAALLTGGGAATLWWSRRDRSSRDAVRSTRAQRRRERR